MNTKKKITAVAAVVLALCLMIGGTIAFIKTNTQTLKNTFTYGAVRLLLDEANLKTPDQNDRTEEGNDYVLEQGETYTKDPTVTVKKGSEPCYVRMLVRVDLKQFNTTQLKAALEAYKTANPVEAVQVINALITDEWLVPANENNTEYKLNTTKLIEKYLIGWDEAVWPRTGIWYGADPGEGEALNINKKEGIAEYTYSTGGSPTIVDASAADVKLTPLFTSFKVPEDGDFPSLPDGVTPIGLIEKLIGYLNSANNTSWELNDLIPDICIVAQAVSVSDFADAAAAFAAAGVPEGFEHIEQELTAPTIPVPTTPTPTP